MRNSLKGVDAETEMLEHAVHTTELWIDQFLHILGWHHRERALTALIAALHAFRDSLPRDEVVYVASHLPTVLRGYFYEGWHGVNAARQLESRASFLNRIQDMCHRDPAIESESVARAMFTLLSSRLPASELENVRALTPSELRAFWPD